jgi:5'-nucleotidase / UDP-sugar diphosphatase
MKVCKKRWSLLALLAVAIICSGCSKVKELDRDLVVLYTNDVHCGVEDYIGYAGLSAYKEAIEEAGNYVLLADAGDIIQGAPIGMMSEGSYLIDILNQMPYDVAAIGNHEFDYGMEQFLELSEMAQFPFVSCNFKDIVADSTVVDPYTIFEFDGVKVAFVGISTPKTITSSNPSNFLDQAGNYIYGFCQDETGEDLYQAVQAAVDSARGEGASYVIALSHLGISASDSPWMSTEVIANTTGIDAVIDGHSHSVVDGEQVKNNEGKNVLLTQTGTKLENIGALTISKEGIISTKLISEYEDKDPEIEAYIHELQDKFSEQINVVIAETEFDCIINEIGTDIRIIRNAETNLGDLCADAYRIVSGADVAMINGGGIRDEIKTGNITYEDIINVHPFGNTACVVEATGQEILDALEMGAKDTPEENGGFQQVSGMTYKINVAVPSAVVLDENGMFVSVDGEYRVKDVKIGADDLELSKTYTLASHNYMIKCSGDGFTMFKDNKLIKDEFMLDSEVLITYITDYMHGSISEEYSNPYGDGRIMAIE